MMRVSSLSKFFGQKKAVDDISFAAKEGEIIGFLGPNGAGKTTTMRLILGYLKPSAGQARIDNLDPTEERIEVSKLIGYLPENNPLYQEMKVREYLEFIASVKKEDDFQKIFKQVDLNEVLDQRIEELSRGYKQRVGLASSLMGNPKILILDEPTSGLDPLEQEKIRGMIKKLANPKDRREKKLIIFSTHILSEVEDVATRLIIIHKGRIVYDGKKPKEKGGVEKIFKSKIKI